MCSTQFKPNARTEHYFLLMGFNRKLSCHKQDDCKMLFSVNVKLGQTSTSNTGRLEVQKESTDGNTSLWGTVCANGFGDTEATVVCHQLGYV